MVIKTASGGRAGKPPHSSINIPRIKLQGQFALRNRTVFFFRSRPSLCTRRDRPLHEQTLPVPPTVLPDSLVDVSSASFDRRDDRKDLPRICAHEPETRVQVDQPRDPKTRGQLDRASCPPRATSDERVPKLVYGPDARKVPRLFEGQGR